MADYDLLNEDDFFSPSKPSPKKEEDKKEEPPASSEPESEEEDIFKDIDQTIQKSIEELPLGEDEQAEQPAEESSFSAEPEEESFESIKQELEEEESEPNEAAAAPSIITDYEDEKQEKISYKPFIIGGVIVVLLIVVFLVIYNVYWKTGPEVATQPAEKKQEAVESKPKISPEELKKQQFYSSVYTQTKNNLNLTTGYLLSATKKARLTSFLIYGNEMMFEIFSPNREQLAKYSLEIRDKVPGVKVMLDNTSIRPGKNGGVFGLFRVQSSAAAAGSSEAATVTNPFGSAAEAQRWLSSLADYNKLKVGKTRNRAVGKKQGFSVYEIDTELTGSYENCTSFLQSVANSGKNAEIYKLTFNAIDQKSFKTSKYQLKLILKVYI